MNEAASSAGGFAIFSQCSKSIWQDADSLVDSPVMETNELSARLAACGMSEVQFRADQLEATVNELTLAGEVVEHVENDEDLLLGVNQIAASVESYAADVVFEYLQILSPPDDVPYRLRSMFEQVAAKLNHLEHLPRIQACIESLRKRQRQILESFVPPKWAV